MAGQSIKSVQEVSKQCNQQERAARITKSDVRYWQSVLFQPTYTRQGQTFQVPDWAVKIQHLGRRETFNLNTPNKAAAASRAKDIYFGLQGAGWDATLAKFKPSTVRPMVSDQVATVGEFIAAAEANSSVRGETFAGYTKALRKIVADIHGIDGGKAKFDHARGGRQRWLEQIDAVSLAILTPESVQHWTLNFVRAAGHSGAKQRAARNSANSFLINARSLFSKKLLKFVPVKLPNPLPFTEVQFEPRGSTRYRSEVDARAFVALAQKELEAEHPERFKIFLLALMTGLRRREIDLLEWSALNFHDGVVRIQPTEHYELKSVNSAGDVEIDVELSQLLKSFYGKRTGSFVIESDNDPNPSATYRYYRCQRHLDGIVAWLRAHGVNTNKPLHTLRKEFGSLLCERGGIYEASRALRHADIRTTSAHYLDRKRRVTVGLGEVLGVAKQV